MNIIISQKDADFILKFIRADLKRVSDSSASLHNNYKRLEKSCTEDLRNLPEVASMMEMATILKKTMDEDSDEIRKDLEKCIEILTIGSYQ